PGGTRPPPASPPRPAPDRPLSDGGGQTGCCRPPARPPGNPGDSHRESSQLARPATSMAHGLLVHPTHGPGARSVLRQVAPPPAAPPDRARSGRGGGWPGAPPPPRAAPPATSAATP